MTATAAPTERQPDNSVTRWMNAETGEVKERRIWWTEEYPDGTTESWPQPPADLVGDLLADLLEVAETAIASGRTLEIHISYSEVT